MRKSITSFFIRYLEQCTKQRLWIQSCLVRQGEGEGEEKGEGEGENRQVKERADHEICLLRRDLPVILPVRSNADLRPLIVCTISSVNTVQCSQS